MLVHGWKLSHRPFEHAILRLARTHRVVAFDLRGMGESDKPNSRYDFDEMADDLEFVLSELGLEDVTLVGWSMGCSVSLQHMARGGRHVARARAHQRPDQARAHRGRQLPVVDDRGRARGVLLRHGAALALEGARVHHRLALPARHRPRERDLRDHAAGAARRAAQDRARADEARLPRPAAAHRGPGARDLRPPRPVLPGRAGGVDRASSARAARRSCSRRAPTTRSSRRRSASRRCSPSSPRARAR